MARKKESLCCLQPLLLCIEKATAFIADYSVSVTGAMLMNKLVFLFFLLQDTFCLAFRLSWRVYIAAYLVTVASLFNGRIEFQRKRRFSRFFARRTQLAWPSSIVEASLPRRPYSYQHTPLHTHTHLPRKNAHSKNLFEHPFTPFAPGSHSLRVQFHLEFRFMCSFQFGFGSTPCREPVFF